LDVPANFVYIPSQVIAELEPDWAGGLLGDKSHSALFDNSKIKSLVPGYTATIPFHLGIRKTIAWFRAEQARWVVRSEVNDSMDRLIATWQRRR
jgi:nucleoside-diphosphate-sugar epimerase